MVSMIWSGITKWLASSCLGVVSCGGELSFQTQVLGRLAAYCAETYQGEAYELYCGGEQRVGFEPQAGLRWSCHQFASRMRPDLSWRLKESLGYPALNIGMSPLLDAAQVIASDMTKNTVPYGIAIEKMLTDRIEVHSFIGTNLSGQSLSVVGGLRPLCLTPNRELSRKYAVTSTRLLGKIRILLFAGITLSK
jgi:hypothetical protein